MTRTELIVVKDPAELRRVAAEWIVRRIESVVTVRGSATIGLTGGSTVRPVYEGQRSGLRIHRVVVPILWLLLRAWLRRGVARLGSGREAREAPAAPALLPTDAG